MPDQTPPRRFHLQRDVDVTGVSGTGTVADGVLWPDGAAAVRWRGPRPSSVHWDRITDAEAVHGHGGATRIVWTDEPPPGHTTPDDVTHPAEPVVEPPTATSRPLPPTRTGHDPTPRRPRQETKPE